jgi:hypothetical protein
MKTGLKEMKKEYKKVDIDQIEVNIEQRFNILHVEELYIR